MDRVEYTDLPRLVNAWRHIEFPLEFIEKRIAFLIENEKQGKTPVCTYGCVEGKTWLLWEFINKEILSHGSGRDLYFSIDRDRGWIVEEDEYDHRNLLVYKWIVKDIPKEMLFSDEK